VARFIPGIDDLLTLHPEVAAEAEGWDPSQVHSGSHKKLSWKCKEGHEWKVAPNQRTSRETTGCPFCSNKKVWKGFREETTIYYLKEIN
tara:strand:+ start:795 stop:1061 length:267 start_codon:yes stop_codon:yes gene_type:complete